MGGSLVMVMRESEQQLCTIDALPEKQSVTINHQATKNL